MHDNLQPDSALVICHTQKEGEGERGRRIHREAEKENSKMVAGEKVGPIRCIHCHH